MPQASLKNTGNIEATTFDELGFDPTGLLGYWSFNGNALDTSVYKKNATVNGSYATLTTDRFGVSNNAYSLDSTDVENKITIPGSSNLYEVGDMTMSVWVSPTVITNNAYTFCHYNWRFVIYTVGNSDFITGRMNDAVGPAYTVHSNATNMVAGNWYHLIGQYHPDAGGGAGYIKYYINGVLQGTVSIGDDIIYTGYGNRDLQWGNSNHGAAVPFQGKIGTSFISSRIFTQDEITKLYNHDLGRFRMYDTGIVEATEFKEGEAITPQVQYKKEAVSLKGSLIEV